MDLDRDGTLDMIAGSRDSGITLHWGNSPVKHHWTFPRGVSSTAVLDENSDGELDILFTSRQPSFLGILRSKGKRQFGPVESLFALDEAPADMWVGNLGGTEQEDVVVSLSPSGDLLYFVDFATSHQPTLSQKGLGEQPRNIRVVDLDSDGTQDVVVLDQGGSALHVTLDPLSESPTLHKYKTTLIPEHMEVVDFDGDGLRDVLLSGAADPSVWLYVNDGLGGLKDPLVVPTRRTLSSRGFASRRSGSQAWVFVGQGSMLTGNCVLPSECSDSPVNVELMDDIQRVHGNSQGLITASTPTTLTLLRAEDLDEEPPLTLTEEESVQLLDGNVVGIAVGDLDQNGWDDVVAWVETSTDSGGMAIFLGGVDGLSEGYSIALPEGVVNVAISPEVALVTQGDGTIFELAMSSGEPSLAETGMKFSMGASGKVGGVLSVENSSSPRGYDVLVAWWSPNLKEWVILRFGPDSDSQEDLSLGFPSDRELGRPFLGSADLDSDGALDAVVHWAGEPIHVLWGGTDTLVSSTIEWNGVEEFSMATISTIDGESSKHLIAAFHEGVFAFTFQGRELGMAESIGGPKFGTFLTLHDMDADGRTDILRENGAGGWLELRGDETGPEIQLNSPAKPWLSIYPIQLNKDSIVDLVGIANGSLVSLSSGVR